MCFVNVSMIKKALQVTNHFLKGIYEHRTGKKLVWVNVK